MPGFEAWQRWKGTITVIDAGIDQAGSSLRILIAQALREFPTSSLYPFLEDRNAVVRTAAAREIQVRGEVDSLSYVTRLVDDKRPFIREIAIFVLGQLGTPDYPYKNESVPVISSKLAHDRSSSVRAAAAAALGHLRAYEAVEILVCAVTDNSVEVRACVASALANMKRSAKARVALDTLKVDSNDEVRRWAID